MLMLHGGNDEEGAHGAGHGGMGHGDAGLVAGSTSGGNEDGWVPAWLLFLSLVRTSY